MSVLTVTDLTFRSEVIEGNRGQLIAVAFITQKRVDKEGRRNASGKMDDLFRDLETDYAGKVKFVCVEIQLDESLKDSLNPLASVGYDIYHGPTVLFIRNAERARENLVGLPTREQLTHILDELLAAPEQVHPIEVKF